MDGNSFDLGQELPGLLHLDGHLEDLRSLGEEDLGPLLAEEAEVLWKTHRWQSNALDPGRRGVAWVYENRVLGYTALGLNGNTAAVARLFSSRHGPTEAVERALLSAVVRGAFSFPGVDRVIGESLAVTPATLEWLVTIWPDQVRLRWLMEVSWARRASIQKEIPGFLLDPWQGDQLHPASCLLMQAYAGTAQVSPYPAYCTPDNAIRYIERIVAHRDCGVFAARASFAAHNPESGHLLGFVLACQMGQDQGHIAQLAVAPQARRQGVGTALLARALDGLQMQGCRATHLTVDWDNEKAIATYQRMGFRTIHRFPDLRLQRESAS